MLLIWTSKGDGSHGEHSTSPPFAAHLVVWKPIQFRCLVILQGFAHGINQKRLRISTVIGSIWLILTIVPPLKRRLRENCSRTLASINADHGPAKGIACIKGLDPHKSVNPKTSSSAIVQSCTSSLVLRDEIYCRP
jgi:hypothetical protein